MINTHDRVRFERFNIENPESWLPVFGKWCGPGWTAGQRTNEVKVSQSLQQSCTDEDIHAIDKLCCIHDEAYGQAAGQPDETEQKIKADVNLIKNLNQLDQSTLSQAEKLYITAMKAVFAIKIGFAQSTLDTLEANTQRQKAMKAVNSGIKKKIDAFLNEKVKTMQEEFSTFEKQLNPSKSASPSGKAESSQHANNFQENEVLKGILTPDILFNADLFAQHQFASAQKKEFVMESIAEVLNAQFPHSEEEDMDFLFKQNMFANHFAEYDPYPSEAERKPKSSRVRNYV